MKRNNLVDFILGEDKEIEFEVISLRELDTIVIKRADFELFCDEKLIKSGECLINGNFLSVKLSPVDNGYYLLIITYEIGSEIFKEKVNINAD